MERFETHPLARAFISAKQILQRAIRGDRRSQSSRGNVGTDSATVSRRRHRSVVRLQRPPCSVLDAEDAGGLRRVDRPEVDDVRRDGHEPDRV